MAIDIEREKVLYAAGALSAAVDELEESIKNISDCGSWSRFGCALQIVLSQNKLYHKTIEEGTAAIKERLLKEGD